MAELIAQHTGQSLEQIEADSDRDRWFTAEEAKAYGFVDHVFPQREAGRLRRQPGHRVTAAYGSRTTDMTDFGMAAGRLHVPGSQQPLHPPAVRGAHVLRDEAHRPYTKLFEDRIISSAQVDDASADDIIAQLIVLESQDPDRDILMYINSPGGSFTAMTAIYDTMQYIRPDVQTFVIKGRVRRGGAARRGCARQALLPRRMPACSSTSRRSWGATTDRRPTWRSRPRRSCGCASGSRRPGPSTPAAASSRSGTSSATRSSRPTRPKEYGLIDEVLKTRKASFED